MKNNLYIGLLSGTSIDGIDAAIVEFENNSARVIASHAHPIPAPLKQELLKLCHPGDNEINRMGVADIHVAQLFSEAVFMLLKKAKLESSDIVAIGSHGQSIRHHPTGTTPFTVQIGDPNTIAAKTNITTVADFRRKDIALDGQGAPLAPGFHHFIFQKLSQEKNVAVVNIGGIANITQLHKNSVIGFDTGPGNTLMDAWIRKHQGQDYDRDGAWGSTGEVHQALLENLLSDPYFKKTSPKSTGPEYFNLAWLQKHLDEFKNIAPVDAQATLLELTAQSIAAHIEKKTEVIICGGGAHNHALMMALKKHCADSSVESSAHYGLDPDWIEAMLFAWLAKQTLSHLPGNIIQVTGAIRPAILGGIYFP